MAADPVARPPDDKPRSVLLREREEVADVQLRSLQVDLLRLIAMVGTENIPEALAPMRSAHGHLVDAHRSLSAALDETNRVLAKRFADALPVYDKP